MHPSRTPRAPPRQIARPKFASTPRFLFSQRAVTQHKETEAHDSIVLEDEASPLPNPRPTPTPAHDASRRKEAIEDSESDLDLEQDPNQRTADGAGHNNEEIPSSPPADMTEIAAEIEELFGPTRHRSKRRRISVSASATLATPEVQKKKPHDAILTSSPEPWPFASTLATNHDPPSPSLPYRTTPQSLRTPRPQPRAPTPELATPATAKPSVRGYPRFLVSSASQAPPKPAFVLPRSPSPDHAGHAGSNAIPTPFSPSSHALRRRGRQRSSTPSYLPGGMASEVRSWVLEMGTKREQQRQIQNALGSGNTGVDSSSVDPSKYSIMLRIFDVRQSALGSCGPLAFIRGQTVAAASVSSEGQMRSADTDADTADHNTRNVLLMGAPRLRAGELRPLSRVPTLQAGDMVGVLRGLVWELPDMESGLSAGREHERILQGENEQSPGLVLGKWLVGMEWDVISPA
ncbi:uncharacterized protein DSM5745_07452 [Aspergillus mulundensis]|uniref:Uncharacterized protein n=1 Tax=Aspergillus mulundensis TaxID=1810919 RepID=A0A3D8RE74_9EURO|nr:Uncharacterized protein DSM5745_07452 [Aspergillus mulundensis]RDW72280.1 Uncharacterized protein DSM5745_07452 [Aspergillus mulundensis]